MLTRIKISYFYINLQFDVERQLIIPKNSKKNDTWIDYYSCSSTAASSFSGAELSEGKSASKLKAAFLSTFFSLCSC